MACRQWHLLCSHSRLKCPKSDLFLSPFDTDQIYFWAASTNQIRFEPLVYVVWLISDHVYVTAVRALRSVFLFFCFFYVSLLSAGTYHYHHHSASPPLSPVNINMDSYNSNRGQGRDEEIVNLTYVEKLPSKLSWGEQITTQQFSKEMCKKW